MRVDAENITYKLSRIDVIRYLLPWPFHCELPACPNGNRRELTFGDLVLSVLPWPFHKDLPESCSDE